MSEKHNKKELEAASNVEEPLEAECVDFDVFTPPDGGFGWFVVLAAFCVQFIVLGVMNNFGVIFSELLVEFKRSKSQTCKYFCISRHLSTQSQRDKKLLKSRLCYFASELH